MLVVFTLSTRYAKLSCYGGAPEPSGSLPLRLIKVLAHVGGYPYQLGQPMNHEINISFASSFLKETMLLDLCSSAIMLSTDEFPVIFHTRKQQPCVLPSSFPIIGLKTAFKASKQLNYRYVIYTKEHTMRDALIGEGKKRCGHTEV
jgi:hypothetical protein